jgi:integrase/recombinase XerD
VLTTEQLAKLYAHLPERVRALSVFLGETGARRTEGMTLQWTQVADDFGAVTFTATKNRKTRRVPLTDRASALLRELHARRVAPMRGADPVFPYCSTSEAARQFRAAVAAAGLPAGATMHSLRHSYAVGLTMAAVPFNVTCSLLGHATPAFTATRYARWVPDGAEQRAVAALQAARAGAATAAAAQ